MRGCDVIPSERSESRDLHLPAQECETASESCCLPRPFSHSLIPASPHPRIPQNDTLTPAENAKLFAVSPLKSSEVASFTSNLPM